MSIVRPALSLTFQTEGCGVNDMTGVDGQAAEDAVSSAADEHRWTAFVDTTATGHTTQSDAASTSSRERTVQAGEITRLR